MADARKPREDHHPLVRVAGTMARLPRYVALARRLVADPEIPIWRKGAVLAGLAYLAWPLDLVPGFIPVAGQLDDLAAVLVSLNTALHGCTDERAAEHLEAAGLTRTALDTDIDHVRTAAGWLAASAARAGGATVRTSARAAGRVLGPIARAALRGARRGASAHSAGRAARESSG
jgi:uncharacterized membrane protein YkvA (DUF1232 family)